jgi:predicted RNA methylase
MNLARKPQIKYNDDYQMSLFSLFEPKNESFITVKQFTTVNFSNYTLRQYYADIDNFGLETVWDNLLEYCLHNKKQNELIAVDNFGELYELGLAYINKIEKKEMGKYYTPDDVAGLMCRWLLGLKGKNICDVACGTGNLVLAYLRQLGKNTATKMISNGNIYLYDLDATALKICRYAIAITYGIELLDKINYVNGDFLDKTIKLPQDCKVITNPPYYKIEQFSHKWDITKVIKDSKDLYSAFMEKIITQSLSSVIISSYSFISGQKFYSLRQVMNNYNGYIVSFDNVPGNIFNGKKHGIFNSNTSNSVRASITVVENLPCTKGFRLSPMIRFKTDERDKLLTNGFLYDLVGNDYQIVGNKQKSYSKCFKSLESIYKTWTQTSDIIIADLITTTPNEFALYIPNSCRYFTTASKTKLSRSGMHILYAKDKTAFNLLYCFINSSFCYWHWRLFDGGINYALNLLLSMPIKYSNDKFFETIASEMISIEKKYIVKKLNAGVEQENIKFPPEEYRAKINAKIFGLLGINDNVNILDIIHSNNVFGGNNE